MVDERGRNVPVMPQYRVIDINTSSGTFKVPLSPAYQNVPQGSLPVFGTNLPNRFRCGLVRFTNNAGVTKLGGTVAGDNMAIPDPNAEDEGKILTFVNPTSQAHTVYFSSLIDSAGGVNGRTFTFAAASATSVPRFTVCAHNSLWTVIDISGVTVS